MEGFGTRGFGNIWLRGSPVERSEQGCHPDQTDQMTKCYKQEDPRSKAIQDAEILMSWKRTRWEGWQKARRRQKPNRPHDLSKKPRKLFDDL